MVVATVKASQLFEVVWVSVLAGVGVTVIFAFVVLGGARSAEARVRDEAAVGEHAVRTYLDELEGGDLHAEVEERPFPDDDPGGRLRGQPHARLEQDVLAELEPALLEHLEHVAVDRPAAERA